LGHVAVLVSFEDTRQPKVADLEQAVAVHKQVAWLDIAMDYAGRVQVLDA